MQASGAKQPALQSGIAGGQSAGGQVRKVYKREGLSQHQPIAIRQAASARHTIGSSGDVVSIGVQEERKVAYSSRSQQKRGESGTRSRRDQQETNIGDKSLRINE